MTSLCINILISGVATIKNKLERDFAQASRYNLKFEFNIFENEILSSLLF